LVSARISDVRVECIPLNHESTNTENVKRDTHADYELAVTAVIRYTISDSKAFLDATSSGGLSAPVIIEAVSSSGVVLGSTFTTFAVVGGGSAGTASAKIRDLSEEEIRRVAFVQASWQYGR